MRLRIDLAYDGSDFHGWARQPALRTVQGELEHALHMILRVAEADSAEPLTLTVAGRTDAGVHAVGQVCHLDVRPATLDRALGHLGLSGVDALQYRLMHCLPEDLVVRRISVAPAGFDARFSALERTYVYRIWDNSMDRDPRMRSFVLPLSGPLDLDAMNQAAVVMKGLHDFGSFATPNPNGTTIRKVLQARWFRAATPEGGEDSPSARGERAQATAQTHGLVCFTITADAFAHNMVRSLVRACIEIGLRRKSVAWFQDKLEHPAREGDTGPISSRGLTLERVAYPADDALAARAASIRAKRTL